MPAAWQKWMPMYIQRLKSNPYVIAMHPAAVTGYLWLVMEQWQSDDCTLPNDVKALKIISGLGTYWAEHSEEVLDRFDSLDGDRLRNQTCYELWMEAKAKYEEGQAQYEALRQIRSVAGKNGAKAKQVLSKCSARAQQEPSNASAKSSFTDTGTHTETNTKDLSEAKASSPRNASGKPDPIEAIYGEYPRKVGKGAALKAISRAVKRLQGAPMEKREAEVYLFRRTQSYARSPAGNDGEFTPHPATWFNRESYDDDQQQWQKMKTERGSNGNQGRNGFSGEEMSELLDSFGGSTPDNAYGSS